MTSGSIYLKEQTATSETGICFKFTETSPGVFNGVIINPEVIPPDDVNDVILSDMREVTLVEFRRVFDSK